LNENVIRYGAEADVLIHEVAIARPHLMSEAYIQRIMAHHTTAAEAGTVFARTRPKLAVYTHLVFLASKEVTPATINELIEETKKTHSGPLEVGHDLMSIEIADQVRVRTFLQTDS
jgi:ribonuclease Z